LTLADFGSIPPPEETGRDFLANALLKARYYAEKSGYPALADDSGLMVKALGGEPGVRSARYGGEGLTDAERNEFLLAKMAKIRERAAKFQAVLALASPSGRSFSWPGELAGAITQKPLGEMGFGYDPVFWEPISGLTLAQMDPAEKNRISHRALAVKALTLDLANGVKIFDF
jgi:XTP/dITP diphosphohydrolase